MQDHLIINLEGPMMSFGGASFDARPNALPLPTRSMIAGLIGNAFGLTRAEGTRLNALQDSLVLTIAIIRHGKPEIDFQTTDLQKPHMVGPMWTSASKPFKREGGPDALSRALRLTPYIADGHYVVAAGFSNAPEFSVAEMLEALREPVRPLFLGRAAYLPVRPIGQSVTRAASGSEALSSAGFDGIEVWTTSASAELAVDIIDMPGTRDFKDYVHRGTDTCWRIK